MSGRMPRIVALALFVGLIAAANPALADGLIIISKHAPGVPPGHYAFAPLQVEYHHVTVTIKDQVAITEVDQVFFNPNNQRLEGDYIFPIPEGAQIDKFSMDVNGKMQDAELLDAAKARTIYEDIVRRMKDPALMEYAGRGLFRVRIFPIEPNSKKQVKLRYTQVLRKDAGLMEYVYPLNTEKFSSAPLKDVSVKVKVETTRPLSTIYSPSHEVEIVRRNDGKQATVGFEARDVRPNTDFALYFAPQADKDDPIGLSLLTFNDGTPGSGGYFMLLATPSFKIDEKQIAPKDVVLVLDTSGSMKGKKLEQAKEALRFVIANLNKDDNFEVIRFSTEAEPLFGKLVANSKENRDKAEAFIDTLRPIGGTAIDEALKLANETVGKRGRDIARRPANIIFLTDGQPTVGEMNEDRIVEHIRQSNVRVFNFGIGTDVNTHLLDRIAEKTHGLSQYVLPDENIEVKVSSFYTRISSPVLSDVKLSVSEGSGVKLVQMYPAPLPDLFKGDQMVVVGRYTVPRSFVGHAAIVLGGVMNGQPKELVMEAPFAGVPSANEQVTGNDFIPRLWATRRVGYLLDEIRLRGDNAELRDEVTQLARQYGIVTPYTAYLIVEDEKRREVPVASQTMPTPMAAEPALSIELERRYRDYERAKSGEDAVGGSQTVDSLKNAPSAPAATAGANRSQGDAAGQKNDVSKQLAESVNDMVTQSQQNSRYVKGRTFYQNGSQWVDAQAQRLAKTKAVQITLGSDAYFKLLRDHPEASAWLALGKQVQVVIAGTLYDITEG
ncbi:MAG: VIT and VWA domain-containing protein [Phycisphaeraceae bacterium]